MLISCFPGGGAVERTPVEIPYQTGSLTYTGSAQRPKWINYDEELMTISGDTSATNAGTYEAVFTLIDNRTYEWPDGTTKPITVEWTIGKASISIPLQVRIPFYTGGKIDIDDDAYWDGYQTGNRLMTIGGTTIATDAGEYFVTFTLTDPDNYQWANGAEETITVSWEIGKAQVTVPSQSGSLSYTGSSQSPTWSNYDSSLMTIGGTTSGTNAGTYTATFTLNDTDNYEWSDGTTRTKSVTWTIEESKTQLAVPKQSGSLTYTGSAQSPTWSNYSTTTMTIGGDTSGTNAGTYTATFSIKDTTLYEWEDGTTETKSVDWTIGKKSLYVPAQVGTLTYNGKSQSPTWDNDYDPDLMTLGGTTSAADAGTYTATFTLKDTDNYQWSDGTTRRKSVTWTIESSSSKTSISMPSNTCTLTYRDSTYGYVTNYTGDFIYIGDYFSNYGDLETYCTVSGEYFERDVGTYTATWSLNDTTNYQWSNGTTSSKSITWSIVS